MDLRFYGADPNEPGENWYRFLSLPDLDSRNYVVPFTYGKFSSRNTRITVRCDIMGDIFAWDRCTVLEWGTVKEFNSTTMTLVDDQLVSLHPDIIAR